MVKSLFDNVAMLQLIFTKYFKKSTHQISNIEMTIAFSSTVI